MIRYRGEDPLEQISRSDRRSWTSAERRVRREHESAQMAALESMAAIGSGMTGIKYSEAAPWPLSMCAPAELIIDGRRVRAARVHRRTLAALRDALASIAAVPLSAVGRYGPYWVLTFRLATEQLVVLVDQLTLLPEWGGGGGREASPMGPLASLGA